MLKRWTALFLSLLFLSLPSSPASAAFTQEELQEIVGIVNQSIQTQALARGLWLLFPKPGINQTAEIQTANDACQVAGCELRFSPGLYQVSDHDSDGVVIHKTAPSFVCEEAKHCELQLADPWPVSGGIVVEWLMQNNGAIHSRFENMMIRVTGGEAARPDYGLKILGQSPDQFTIVRGNHFSGARIADLWFSSGFVNGRVLENRWDSSSECPFLADLGGQYWNRLLILDSTMDVTAGAGNTKAPFCFRSNSNYNGTVKILSARLEATGQSNTAGMAVVHYEASSTSSFLQVNLDGVTGQWGCGGVCTFGQSIFGYELLPGGTGGFLGIMDNSLIEHEFALSGDWRSSLLSMWPPSGVGPHNGVKWWVDPRKSDAANAAQDANF